MNVKGKYLVGTVRDGMFSTEVAVCFPEIITHATIGRRVFVEGSIRSGGFFKVLEHGDIHVYGESTSANVKSEPGDALRIAMALGMELNS